MELAEFLLARVAEDEVAAKAATPGPWVPDSQGWDNASGESFIQAPYHELDISDEDVQHVTRWQPARVLAECEAKQLTITWLTGVVELSEEGWQNEQDRAFATYSAERALQALALPYANHPDYRQEWRP